jgi:hypothetical protein
MWKRPRHSEFHTGDMKARDLQIHQEAQGILILIWIMMKCGLKVWSRYNRVRPEYKAVTTGVNLRVKIKQWLSGLRKSVLTPRNLPHTSVLHEWNSNVIIP